MHITDMDYDAKYKASFKSYIEKGVKLNMLNPVLDFDIDYLSKHLVPSNDLKFKIFRIPNLLDRYLLRDRTPEHNIYELPQWFWMRVAMGLALKEGKEKSIVEFYNVLSEMNFVSSTPTLFNSGMLILK